MSVGDLILAIGLILVFEGLVFALFPNSMKKAMAIILQQSSGSLQIIGLISTFVGLLIILGIR